MTSTFSHSCGCSILSKGWALTAGHCVNPNFPENYYNVQYGLLNIINDESSSSNVTSVIVHENYAPLSSYMNDIALLKLATPILEFNNLVQPVRLPQQNQIAEGGSDAVLAGWGFQQSNGSIQKHLQFLEYFIVSNEECNTIHSSTIHSTHVCAAYPGGMKGQCSGDSGGPLFVDGQQVGIVSWSMKPCAIAPYPGVFTAVGFYVDWINENCEGCRDEE